MVTQSYTWYQALTLTERLTTLKTPSDKRPGEIDAKRAARVFERWRVQPPFDQDGLFSRRMEMDGITEEELKYLLGEPAESLRDRCPSAPEWLQQFSEAFSLSNVKNGEQGLAALLTKAEDSIDQKGILFLIEPLFDYALHRFRDGIGAITESRQAVPFDPQAVESMFVFHLFGPVLNQIVMTVALELNIARLRGDLGGGTPEARFNSFIESLRDRARSLTLLKEYPVLARQVTVRIGYWTNYFLEFLRHLCDDLEKIQTFFGRDRELGLLNEISGGIGDSHREGRAVLIATFTSGFKIVYKPKSLTVDVHFQELLQWLNERGSHPPFRTLMALDCEEYGWVEFVANEGCASAAEVERFYQRQGGYLALLYVLQATDFHLENLIAVGEDPVLIDLESLFHPSFSGHPGNESDRLANESLNHSVFRTGLLPRRLWASEESEGVDLSGLGGAPGQLTPFKVAAWEGVGTDEMRMSRKRVEMPGGQNRPFLNGAEVNVLDYSDALIAGFTSLYLTLQKHRDELLAENGPLARFAEDEVRVILRPTSTYAQLLHEAYHPNLLRDGLDRERFFDRLWITVRHWPDLARVIAGERADLNRGDIPMFTTRIGALDIWTSAGERIPHLLKESSLDLTRRVISELSDKDLEKQLWFIRASLTSLSVDSARSPWPTYVLTGRQRAATRDGLLQSACRLGDRLEQIAVRSNDNATWLGLSSIDERHWSLAPLGIDLYNGVPGVTLFLARLGDITGEERYADLARAATITFQRRIDLMRPVGLPIGGFNGLGGVIYSLLQLGALWKDTSLFEQAEDLFELTARTIENDRDYDIILGSAGALSALLSFYDYTGSPRSLALATRCGDHLVASGRKMDVGLGWCGRHLEDLPLAGFSHGVAGIACALLRLAARTGCQQYKTTALEAIKYERSLYSPEVRGWRDLRKFPSSFSIPESDAKYSGAAWCHGAPGIGLGRLSSLNQMDDPETRAEIQTALEITLSDGFGRNHSLCHGDLGNLDFVLEARTVLGEEALQTQIDHFAAIILECIEQQGAFCGVPLGVETPGLMTGLAGIGYGLLRLAEPEQIPSVLLLSPPPGQSQIQPSK
jgi:type 2 lantibiotic biosynthesis protein LanM